MSTFGIDAFLQSVPDTLTNSVTQIPIISEIMYMSLYTYFGATQKRTNVTNLYYNKQVRYLSCKGNENLCSICELYLTIILIYNINELIHKCCGISGTQDVKQKNKN